MSLKKSDRKQNSIKIGVSACLLGEKVRWDSGHKKDSFLTDVLGRYFIFVPVCPEVEVGMGVPRESVRLVGDISSPRMVGNKAAEDWTDRMKKYIDSRMPQLESYGLSGYILKKDSPSCGMERVRVYGKSGAPSKKGRGMFGGALVDRFKNLPIEEEGRLNDHALRDNFIVIVFAYNRLINLFDNPHKRGDIVAFHTAHKYLLLAHSPRHYTELGRLVAGIADYSPRDFEREYGDLFMKALAIKSTPRKNANVLNHIMGYLKTHLTSGAKTDILKVIENYRKGLIPLVVPLTLIRHYIDLYKIDYVRDQVYLSPHPEELMLRNHV